MSKNTSTTMKMIIDAQMNVNNVRNGLSAIASGLKELNVPKGVTTELQRELNSLNNKIKEFDLLAKDADNSFKNSSKIQKSFEGIDLQVKKFLQTYEEITGLDPSKIFPKEITEQIKAATAAYEKYNKARKADNDITKQLKQDRATAQRKKSNAESTLEVRKTSLEAAKSKRDKGKQEKSTNIKQLEKANQALSGRIERVQGNEGYKNLQAQKELLIQIEQKRKDINKLTRASNKTEKDSEDLKSYQKEKTQLEQQLKKIQSQVTKSQQYKSSSDVDATIQKKYPSISENTKQMSENTAEIKKNKSAIDELELSVTKAQEAYNSQKTVVDTLTDSLNETSNSLKKAQTSIEGSALKEFYQDLEKANVVVNKNVNAQENYNSAVAQINVAGLEKVNQAFEETAEKADKANQEIEEGKRNLQEYGDAAKNFQSFKDEIDSLGQRATYFLSLENSVDLFKQAVRQAVDTIKELDAAMTETAVVTDFSVGDMWKKLPEYTKMANELGVATKGVYDASTLYYQQGLQTEQVMALTAETLKMARIAGLECADATDLMTAALRGFNMEINETSAQKINDVYSELAAITAADTNEIATAMTKTASIAKSANMEFETTAALLSQMIETTREPAETAGTALKTIIARFTEMKKSISGIATVDGEEISVNKVDAALASAGVSLKNANNEFRDLDDVLLELASKWDSLDIMTQRYIATTAAGSRQQSRFIAMLQDYDRTMELVDAAYNSAGSSSKQFEKTQESLESMLARLQNAWNDFLMGIADDKIVKFFVNALTGLISAFNNLTKPMDGVIGSAIRLGTVFGGLRLANVGIQKAITQFVTLRRSVEGTEGAYKSLSAVQKLTQKINNFSSGKSFAIDSQVDTKGFKNKIEAMKSDWAGLKQAISGGTLLPDKGITIGFEKIDDAIAATSSVMNSSGKAISIGFSEAGNSALLASDACKKIGENLITSGLDGEQALSILQNKYNALIEQAEKFQTLVNKSGVSENAKQRYLNAALERQNQASQISGDIGVLEKLGEEGGKQYSAGLIAILKKRISKVGTTITGGLSKLASAFGASGAAAGGLIAAGIVAAVAAVAVTIYAIWHNSAGQAMKRIAATDAATLKRIQEEVEALKTKVNDLSEAWDNLTEHSNNMEGLVQGTSEWKKELQASNEEIQNLLSKYPELYKFLSVDKQTGQWLLDKDGYLQYQNQQEEELADIQNRQIFQEMIATSSQSRYEAITKQKNKNGIMDFGLTQGMLEFEYAQGLRKIYEEVYGNSNGVSLSLEELAQDPNIRDKIENMTEKEAKKSASLIMGISNPKAALEYADDIMESDKIAKQKSDAYVRSYMASTNASDLIQEAVAGAYSRNKKINLNEQIKADRDKRNFDGGTGGTGIKMQGKGTEDQPTVQSIMEQQGYKLVDSLRNVYQNENTGQYVNVDKVGNADSTKTSTRKVNGEKVEVLQWSDEYVRDIDRTEGIRTKSKSDINTLAQAFLENEELAKVVAGDLSAKIDESYKWKNITNSNDEILLDTQQIVKDFEDSRSKTMDDLNAKYGDAFTGTTESQFVTTKSGHKLIGKIIKTYSDDMYEAAQATVQFEESVSGLGSGTAQILTSTFLALYDLENSEIGLNTAIDDNSNLAGSLAKSLQEAGISAQGLQNFVSKLDMSSAIGGAKQLKQALDEGGQSTAYANAVIMADVGGFYSVGNQFKEMISNEEWADTQKSLTEIYNLTGNISADNIRELAEESSDLAAILETNSLKASGFAELMKAVESGTIDLTNVTTDLIKVYEGLYYSIDLAGEAIARLEKAKIGDSDTKIGNIYSESWGKVQDLIERGAYGDSQIDDYMNQLVGSATWSDALSAAKGDKTKALETIDQTYGLSANSGNLYGSWNTLLGKLGGSVANGAISVGADGTLNYDLSKVGSTQELVEAIVNEMQVSEDYVNTLLADMKTYSKTFSSDLEDLDKRGTLEDFLSSRTTKDNVLNISESELKAFAKSRNQSVEEFKKELLSTSGIMKIEDRSYSESGYYYTTTDKDTGETQVSFTDEKAKKQIEDKIGEIKVPVSFTDSSGKKAIVTQDYLNELLQIDEIREIVLDPKLSEESKKELLSNIEGISSDIANSLFSEESIANAERYADYLGVQMYNSLGGYLTEAMNLLAEYKITIPVGFSFGEITIPDNAFTRWLKIAGATMEIGATGGFLKIGGEGSSMASSSGGGFTPKTSSYSPSTTGVNFNSSGGGSGTGKGYLKGNDTENDPTKENGGGSNDEEKNRTNYSEENANKQLDALERLRETNDREAELIDKLPEEIQFPLKMANLGEDMFYEYQEIQINKNKLAALESQKQMEQANAEFLNKYYYFDELLDAYMYNIDAMNSLSDEERDEVEEEINSLQELQDKINEVNQELDGGKVQKIFRGLAKASTSASKALKGTSKASDMLEEEFGDLADKFGLGDQLDKFGKSLDSAIDESKFLKKEFKGLGIASEDMLSKIDNLPFGDATKSLIKNTLGTNENGTIGSFLGDSFGAAGEMFDGIADVLNFDMMSMGLDAFNNMKDMASKIIQQVVSVIQTVVSWWTNREDWLYNLLSAIEQEVHNFNRQEQVEERFRLYSDEGLSDLVSAWEAMRASLEKQIDLNEQLIKSRQAELQFLNLTNLPFSPAFYYDYKEERVIENPWVYDIYVLLLDLGSMIPEIGGVFSSIKQLMEDNKKRMENAVDEIESAREQILELEKQQLELRTKYMEDEEELEQLVMDAIIEKQQEEIDELTAMNDAISEGNQKLIDALNDNLDKIRDMRDNQDREEELAQKERRLAYLRQDTSGANRAQILDLQEELEDERRDYTDTLIDQKISELEKQNEDAAEQRQKQIDLLQEQLDYTEKYGLQWQEAQTLIKNGFDNEGRLRVGSELFDLLMSKEDFTSLGNGSTRQNRQIMDWNVTGIAAAAYREINDIWDKGFGNFEMSNDVHDQSNLHLWEDRDIEYRQLPSWLSFLQPAYNSIQDYAWRTKQNIGSFVETGYLSGSNSSSILGKTLVPLVQKIAANIETAVNDYKSISEAETGGAQTIAGVITSSTDNLGLSLGEKILSGFSKSISTLGDDIISGVKVATQSNSSKTVTSTQNYGDIVFNNHFDSEENGDSIIERMVDFFRKGNQGLSVV